MGLRILLADDSSTIKKVFQLALQDYAVEVQTVAVGIDVIAVAQEFHPDIIFADILLKKRSGYLVSSDLKSHAQLKAVPVILIWSGFIELDQDKFQASGANAELEKPFEVSTLRKLVQDMVPKTQSQKLASFLTMPKNSSHTEPSGSVGKESVVSNDASHLSVIQPASAGPGSLGGVVNAAQPETRESSWDMNSFKPIDSTLASSGLEEEDDQFSHLPLTNENERPLAEKQPAPDKENILENSNDEAIWVQKDLSDFKISSSTGPEGLESSEYPIDYTIPEADVHSTAQEIEPLAAPKSAETPSLDLNSKSFQLDSRLDLIPDPSEDPPLPENPGQTSTVDEVPSSIASDSAPYIIDEEIDLEGVDLEESVQSAPPIETDFNPKPTAPPLVAAPEPDAAAPIEPRPLTEAQLENIIRTQSLPMLEKVIWQVVPDLARQIIEKELHRLLKEQDKEKV